MSVNSSVTIQPFLKTCTDELNPDLLASFQRKSTLWHVASVASNVALKALLLGSITAAVIFAPTLFPITAITCLVLIGPTETLYKKFAQYSKDAHERAQQLEQVGRHHDVALRSATPADLQWFLGEMGIQQVSGMQHDDPRLLTLKPVMARHYFWDGHTKKLEKEHAETLKEITELKFRAGPAGFAYFKEDITSLECKALEQERVMLVAKVKTAFVNAFLRRPDYQGTLEELGQFSQLSGTERAIATAAKTDGATDFFTLNWNQPSLKFDEVKQLSAQELGTRLSSAMGARP